MDESMKVVANSNKTNLIKEESNDCGWLLCNDGREVESAQNGRRVQECRESCKNGEEVNLRDA